MDVSRDLARLACLAEPTRRALYLVVASSSEPVGRDRAARAVGVTRALAAFHLEKLVDEGLVVAEYRRLFGKGGPGAGRPAKLYRRAATAIGIALPPQNYLMVASLLAGTLAGSPAGMRKVREAAVALGTAIGAAARRRSGPRPSQKRLLAALSQILGENGFEPSSSPDGIGLNNCPFYAVAAEYRDLVCGMNLALMDGVREGLGVMQVQPVLEVTPGMCCVAFRKP